MKRATRIKTIPTTLLENPELSLSAKGLFALLNIKDTTYKPDPKDIMTVTNSTEEEVIEYIGELMKFEHIQFLEDGTYVLIDNNLRREKIVDMQNVKRIIAYWNTKKIIQVRKETPDLIHKLEKALKIYSYEEVIQGIDNYEEILHSTLTWWEYEWTLGEFISRAGGLQVFLEKDISHYLDKKNPQAQRMMKEEEAKRIEKANKEVITPDIQKSRKESQETKQKLMEAWTKIPIDHREIIDFNVNVKMKRYENLKVNIPSLYEDSRKQTKLREIAEYMKNPWVYQKMEVPKDTTTP